MAKVSRPAHAGAFPLVTAEAKLKGRRITRCGSRLRLPVVQNTSRQDAATHYATVS